jgi:hypothetical protein
VHNLTTGAPVLGKSIKKALLIALAISAVMAITFVVIFIRADNKFHNDVDQQRRVFCEQAKQNGQTPPGC